MKKKLILTTLASIVTIGTVSGVVALNSTPQKAGADDTPIVQTLADHSKELANHEARITNAESNIGAVANKTGTTTTTTVVEQVPAPTQAQTPTPEPVTVTAYEQIPVDPNGSTDCKLTYSDGTTYQWHWKVVQGNNTSTTGVCNSMVLGNVKN